MKTMTCKQMGGPCDMAMHANTAEEMMKAGAAHIMSMAAMPEDKGHNEAMQMMQDMQAHPEMPENQAWTADFMAKFAAMPEDME
jgi:hypothetical protein